MQRTGSSGYNGSKKWERQHRGMILQNIWHFRPFSEKWVLQMGTILCYTVLDKIENEVKSWIKN